MLKTSLFLTTTIALMLAAFGAAASPINKCVINGSVTYQHQACPSNGVAKRPTVEELNTENKRRRAAAAADKANNAAPSSEPTPASSAFIPSVQSAPSSSPVSSFRCDGRKYCSQMTSCQEAKKFLASCPGMKLDGNNDGVPCEQQWCSH